MAGGGGQYSRDSLVLTRGLSVVTQFLMRPKLDVKEPIINSIRKNNQVVRKEIYLGVANKGKTTAKQCRALLIFPGFGPQFNPPSIAKMMLQRYHHICLDWFEPSTMAYGLESAVPLAPETASKEVDIFPDPEHVFYAGTIWMDSDGVAQVQTTDTIRGQPAQMVKMINPMQVVHADGTPGPIPAGSMIDVTVEFSGEPAQVKSVCKKYRLDTRSFETFSMTPT
jgi:hypothetical protein